MKKTLQFSGILAATLVSGLLFFTSCQKESNPNANDESKTEISMATKEDAEANMVFDDAYTTVIGTDDDAGIGTGVGIFGRTTNEGGRVIGLDSFPRCFTITRVPAAPGVFPKTVTIDFGNGCTGPDGRTRKGKIVTVYTGRLVFAGSEATTTFTNYYVDSLHIEGTMKVKNNSTGTTRIFTRTVVNGKVSKPSGNNTQWNATHTNTQTAGTATPFILLDDEFDITGSAAGQTNYNNHSASWTHTITNPLHRKFLCRWFSSGTIVLTVNNRNASLDYGNGTCDNQATLTLGGQSFPITLH